MLNEQASRFIEKTVKTTYGSSIRQHYALIYNFDVRFVEICLVFADFYENWLGEFEIRNCFRRSGVGA